MILGGIGLGVLAIAAWLRINEKGGASLAVLAVMVIIKACDMAWNAI